MTTKTTENLIINGIEYTAVSNIKQPAVKKKNMKYAIVRTYSAWVFAWYIEKRTWQEVILRDARRLWKWEWAASLSQLATDWTSKPSECKFPCEVDTIELLNAIEILDCTKKAQDSIAKVPVWSV